MSGIAGAFFFDGRPLDQKRLEAVLARLVPRGPDGSGVWAAGSTALAHSSLLLASPSMQDSLPLVSVSGRLVVTADARLDNREELAGLLHFDGQEAAQPDSFFILRAYEQWGEACAARLLGDFAFAVWDCDQQRLYCARDPFGVKPFYYAFSPQGFIFASEIKALFAWDEVPRRLDELRFADFILNVNEDQQITFFEAVKRLPPAHYLSLQAGGSRLVSYWSLGELPDLKLKTEEDYNERFRYLFTQAVKARIGSAPSFGCALSGGLDSSSIACMARDIFLGSNRLPVATYSALFSGVAEPQRHKIDERRFIDAVLQTGGFEPHFIEMAGISPLAEVEKILCLCDEPYYAPYLPLYWSMYAAARQQGTRVFLEGFDGDAVVSHGFERLTELSRRLRWRTLLHEARQVAQHTGLSRKRLLWHYSVIPFLPQSLIFAGNAFHARRTHRRVAETFLAKEFSSRKEIRERLRVARQLGMTVASSARQQHLREVTSGLWPYTFELLDKLAANFSISLGYPFFDRRLVEFCLTVPSQMKLSAGWTRFILRQAMSGILPEPVRWRETKADFRPYYQAALQEFERPLLEEVILRNPGSITPYLDQAQLQLAYQSYISGSGYSGEDVKILFQAVLLSLWFKQNSIGG